MGNASRLLARMSAGAQSLTVGRGTSPDRLTQMDISLAAGRIPDRLAYLWVVHRYGGHETQGHIQALETAMVLELSRWAVQGRWRLRGGGLGRPGRLRALAGVWMAERAHPCRCGYCRGSGKIFDAGALRHTTCPPCGGHGITQWSARKRAEWLGVDHAAWVRTWASRYDRLNRFMHAKEGHGLRIVSLELSDE